LTFQVCWRHWMRDLPEWPSVWAVFRPHSARSSSSVQLTLEAGGPALIFSLTHPNCLYKHVGYIVHIYLRRTVYIIQPKMGKSV
jgi:hypothetical protein